MVLLLHRGSLNQRAQGKLPQGPQPPIPYLQIGEVKKRKNRLLPPLTSNPSGAQASGFRVARSGWFWPPSWSFAQSLKITKTAPESLAYGAGIGFECDYRSTIQAAKSWQSRDFWKQNSSFLLATLWNYVVIYVILLLQFDIKTFHRQTFLCCTWALIMLRNWSICSLLNYSTSFSEWHSQRSPPLLWHTSTVTFLISSS